MYDHLATASAYDNFSCRFNLICDSSSSNCGFKSSNFSVDGRVILCESPVLQQGGS